jgi:hypothetical protein
MEMSQENSLCNYLKQTKMSFSFYKIGEQGSRTGPVWSGGQLTPIAGGRRWIKGVG